MSITFDSTPQYWVNRLGFALRKELTGRFHQVGLTASAEDWAMLRFLGQGAQPTSALSDATLRDRTTVTRAVDKLVARGWVARLAHDGDRRRTNLSLTEAGRAVLRQMADQAAELLAETNTGISPEDQQIATSVLQRMFANLQDPTTTGGNNG